MKNKINLIYMETSQEYDETYNGLTGLKEYESYIDSIENIKKYIDKSECEKLKNMLVNASRNQGAHKAQILALLDKKIRAIDNEIARERKTVGSIYRIDEDAAYGLKRRRNKKVQKRTKTNRRRKSSRSRRNSNKSTRRK
jgi:hypothetical protein